jgi:hypothetical protein
MARQSRPEPSERSQQQTPSSKEYEIAKALTRLSIQRQAEVSEETFMVYADSLREFMAEDVRSACEAIGREPRKSFEKPFPEVGMLIEECRRQSSRRQSLLSRTKACGACIQGMVRVFNAQGYCTGVIACKLCSGPTWFSAALEHNKKLMEECG